MSTLGLENNDFSFKVTARIASPFNSSLDHVLHVIKLERPYRKQYGAELTAQVQTKHSTTTTIEEDEESGHRANEFFAALMVAGQAQGYVHVQEMWNKMASLEDIAVDSSLRGQGVGKALVSKALQWTKAKGLHALRAETQDNNIAACHLYQRCGFKFGGYDNCLYAANEILEHETALF